MRAIIFANGRLDDTQRARDLVHDDDLIIAVDGGTRRAWEVGVEPQCVIGDLDSLTPAEEERLRASGARIIRFSPRKDETDLELALVRAAFEGAESIVVLAALGGRLDHTIANLLLLALPELDGIDVRVVEGLQVAFLVRREALVEGEPGDTVSLIPLGGDAVGVTTEGLEWRLNDDTLHFGPARGVSNALIAERASVRVQEGQLLCVVTHASE